MAGVKEGKLTSEWVLTKYGSAIAVAAPVAAAVLSRWLGVEVPTEQVVDLATNALLAVAAMVSAYSVGRSIVKSRSK